MADAQSMLAPLTGRAAEVFRGLWAATFQASARSPKAVVVCSASRQEGATTVACGLSMAGATAEGVGRPDAEGERVALVDFNLRSPALHRRLGLKDGPGVSEVLLGSAGLDEAIRPVGPGALDVLPAGGGCERLVEILRADRLRPMLEELSGRYNQIIFDASPANRYPDTAVLAGVVGSAVLVARSEHTPREALAVARRSVESTGAKVIGVVLNMRKFPIPRFIYRRM